MNRLQANLCLVCVTIFWSTEVLIYACIPAGVSSFATVSVTSLVGAALMFVPFFRRVVASLREGGVRFVLSVLGLAVLNVVYSMHFIAGMRMFDPTESAFVSCLGVVVMPLVMMAMRRRITMQTWLSVALVAAGVVFALLPTFSAPQFRGLFLISVGSALSSVSVILLADLVRGHDPVAVAVLRKGFMSVFAFAGWFATDPRLFAGLPFSKALVSSWAVYAYLVVAFSQVLNMFAMRRVPADDATVIYSMKLVFTLLLGLLIPAGIITQIELSPRVIVGTALVVAGSLAKMIDFGAIKMKIGAKT